VVLRGGCGKTKKRGVVNMLFTGTSSRLSGHGFCTARGHQRAATEERKELAKGERGDNRHCGSKGNYQKEKQQQRKERDPAGGNGKKVA